jgi:tRNA (guanine-N7-)-methyltransferase
MTVERRSRSTEAFFGRRHGKTIRPLQAGALADVLPGYRIDLAVPPPKPLTALFEVPVAAVRLEIGFGSGEHLMHAAGLEPSVGFIGVEPFVNGMARLMQSLGETPLGNVKVYGDDATRVLDWLAPASIAAIDLFYPDPWPKKRHWKRRFVSRANLDRFARVIEPGGVFRFASDIDSYVNWTLLHCRAHPAFEWAAGSADDWRRPYPDWPGTRYEGKAVREGRRPAYLTFRRHPAGQRG